MSAAHQYAFEVKMTCSGCSGAVTRALKRAQEQGKLGEGATFIVDLEKQTAVVYTDVPYENVHEIISKTGKQVISGTEVGVDQKESLPPVELENVQPVVG